MSKEEIKYMKINIGGSNRKLAKDISNLQAKFKSDFRYFPGTRSSGMHHSNQQGSIPDTLDNRKWLKENKISVARK